MTGAENRGFDKDAAVREAEATLRLVAQLPSPAGLEERVQQTLRTTPAAGRLLAWPERQSPAMGWLRGTAAAAIVCVVAGGAWTIYQRVQPVETPTTAVAPRPAAQGGFSTAGAIRTPQTLNGPVLVAPVKKAEPPQTGKKPAAAAKKKPVVPSAK